MFVNLTEIKYVNTNKSKLFGEINSKFIELGDKLVEIKLNYLSS